MVYGLWFMVYGLWFMVSSLKSMVNDLWFMVHGLWLIFNGLLISSQGLTFIEASSPAVKFATCFTCLRLRVKTPFYLTESVYDVVL